ncbi:Aste57867_8757 [Aphanomyces stellatus]|uniref:Aste57867_8757 protein n=1 Tax=Aphanomyces stellatus TaxID=120398 RepID=A0A485KL86_9STRA|nr:hypothetical protein As57867_008723 [Aphanomyces stellatus]VFT85643.1 Aste57867_8757 [Aphanomyces stellatus]
MNRFRNGADDSFTLEYVTNVLNLDTRYLKDGSNPHMTPKTGIPGIFPTNKDNDEEKYHFFAKRRTAYVAGLPRGLGPMPTNWHKQYAFFSNGTPIFDRLAPLLTSDGTADEKLAASSSKKKKTPDSFVDYLVRQVRRFDANTGHLWMLDLTSGNYSIPDLIQKHGGIPFEQWRASPDSKCPLLDLVAKYDVGMMEATWYIRINVIYQELNEMRRDRDRRLGDWFYHSKRFQRRAFEWTDQLLYCLHATARQCFKLRLLAPKKQKDAVKPKAVGTTMTKTTTPPPVPVAVPDDKFRYILRLSEYHFHLNMLDRVRYFNGLLSLYQKSLLLSEKTPIKPGEYWSVLPMPVNQLILVIALVQKLLPEMLKDTSIVKLLVKITLAHFQVLVPDFDHIHEHITNVHQERLIVALCDILREVLRMGADHLVHMKDEVLKLWPSFVLTDQFFPGEPDEMPLLAHLQRKLSEVRARKARLSEFYSTIARRRGKDTPPDKKFRNEVDIIELLDEFHGGKSKLEVADVYAQIFVEDGVIDVHAIFTICEWAVTIYRSQEYKYISAAYLLEMRNDALLEGRSPNTHEAMLQDTLWSFLISYEPKHAIELASVIDLFSLLIRRRLFLFESFVECVSYSVTERDAKPSAVLSQPKFQFEYGQIKGGFNVDGLTKLTRDDRLRLYLWQFPRGEQPFPHGLSMTLDVDNEEFVTTSWMELVQVTHSEIKRSRALERVMILSVQIFQMTPGTDLILTELDQMARIVELYSLVKKLSAHDKGRYAVWLLRHVYEIPSSFFVLNELNTMEHVLRLLCLLLELVDVLCLLEVLIHFLRHAPVYIVKTVVLPTLDRHHMTFYACQDILALIQAFEYRVSHFQAVNLDSDDKYQTIAMFICRIYQSNSKALDKALKSLDLHSPPEVLMKAFFAILKEDKLKDSKEMGLEGVNHKCAFPKDKDVMGPDMQELMQRVFAALQKSEAATATELQFTHIMGMVDTNDLTCRDPGVEDAVNAILIRGQLTSQQRIFMFRAFLTEIMEKWMHVLHVATTRATGGGSAHQSIYVLVPQYIHRCVRVLRDVIDGHEESERKLIRDTLLTWLNKEVVVAFNGVEPTAKGQAEKPKSKNVFLPKAEPSGKEAFSANLKGHLDKIQYGLKVFLVSLVVNGIVDLTQVLRFVLVPGFPKKNASAAAQRTENRSLSNQILSMTLAFHLLGDSPPQFVKLGHNVFANCEDPMVKYHWRFLRSMVPCCVMFPFVFLLCQMSYHWSLETNSLMPRQERGALASTILFDCTNDMVVREIIFSDKEVRERHVLKDNENIWFMSVIMKLLFREINTPAEVSTNRIQLLKAEEIFESMTKWMIHRGGAIYLEVEMIRQHLKVTKRTKRRSTVAPPIVSELPTKLPLTVPPAPNNGYNYALLLQTLEPTNYKFDKEDAGASASDKIGMFVLHRVLAPCVRPLFLAPPVGSDSKLDMQLARREAADLALANLYASTLCAVSSGQIATSLITAVVARVLESLEEDARTTTDEQYLHTFNGSMVSALVRGILTWHGTSNNIYLRYMRSLKLQMELLLQTCQSYEAAPLDYSMAYVSALRRKIGFRLQLVSITASVTNYTLPYRNGMVKMLFSMLGTAVVNEGVGLTLFGWILDLIPLIPCTLFAEFHYEDLVRSLRLPPTLARRVFAVFPKTMYGATPLAVGSFKVDPWALLEGGVPDLPSRSVVSPDVPYTKRQRLADPNNKSLDP